MKLLLKKINIFTVLVIVVTLSLALRLNTVVDNFGNNDGDVRVFTSASAVEATDDSSAPEMSPEEQVEMFRDGPSEEDRIQEERGLPEFPVVTFSETEIEVLQSLSARRKALEEREKRISQKEALLKVAEQEVDRKISELASLRAELEKLLDQQETLQEDRLRRMVKIYESMKPKEAAAIFNTLDMDVLLSVLGRMSERKSAPIFASMNPQRAQEVTIRLVEQKKLPELPKE
jgi:flagellar motility protein MotE (MotC chaperone)